MSEHTHGKVPVRIDTLSFGEFRVVIHSGADLPRAKQLALQIQELLFPLLVLPSTEPPLARAVGLHA